MGLLPSSFEDVSAVNNTSSLLLLSNLSKNQVEAAVLDYDLALQSSLSLAYAAILTSHQTTSMILDLFSPMDLIN
jgi:hypothetical protein